MSHYTLPEIVHLPEAAGDLTLEQLGARAQRDLESENVVIEFSRDILYKFVCPACRREEERFAAAASLGLSAAKCPVDGQLRSVETLHSYSGEPALAQKRLDQLGLPLLDLFLARNGERETGYIPWGDEEKVLGAAAREDDAG
jgi:hypothetical protein